MRLYTIPCVIFTGGKSSRMGEDKAFLPFANTPSLVQYQYERLRKMFTQVYLSAKDKSKFYNVDAAVIEDLLHKEVSAPTIGLINSFRQLKDENAFFVLSVDTPFVDNSIISKLVHASNTDYDAYIIRTNSGIHPLCGIYTRALEEPLKEMVEKGEHRLTKLLKKSNVCYIDVEDEDLLLNLNTPAQYKQALKVFNERS